jgi:hypothetical protein
MRHFLLISAASLLMAGNALAQEPASPATPATPATPAQPADPGAAPATRATPATPAEPAAPAASAQAQSSLQINDDELKRFATLAKSVKQIMAENQAKIAAAADAAAKSKAEAAMSGELQVAVTDNGFTVSRYNEIASAMQKDPTLVTRMQQLAAGGQRSTTSSQ